MCLTCAQLHAGIPWGALVVSQRGPNETREVAANLVESARSILAPAFRQARRVLWDEDRRHTLPQRMQQGGGHSRLPAGVNERRCEARLDATTQASAPQEASRPPTTPPRTPRTPRTPPSSHARDAALSPRVRGQQPVPMSLDLRAEAMSPGGSEGAATEEAKSVGHACGACGGAAGAAAAAGASNAEAGLRGSPPPPVSGPAAAGPPPVSGPAGSGPSDGSRRAILGMGGSVAAWFNTLLPSEPAPQGRGSPASIAGEAVGGGSGGGDGGTSGSEVGGSGSSISGVIGGGGSSDLGSSGGGGVAAAGLKRSVHPPPPILIPAETDSPSTRRAAMALAAPSDVVLPRDGAQGQQTAAGTAELAAGLGAAGAGAITVAPDGPVSYSQAPSSPLPHAPPSSRPAPPQGSHSAVPSRLADRYALPALRGHRRSRSASVYSYDGDRYGADTDEDRYAGDMNGDRPLHRRYTGDVVGGRYTGDGNTGGGSGSLDQSVGQGSGGGGSSLGRWGSRGWSGEASTGAPQPNGGNTGGGDGAAAGDGSAPPAPLPVGVPCPPHQRRQKLAAEAAAGGVVAPPVPVPPAPPPAGDASESEHRHRLAVWVDTQLRMAVRRQVRGAILPLSPRGPPARAVCCVGAGWSALPPCRPHSCHSLPPALMHCPTSSSTPSAPPGIHVEHEVQPLIPWHPMLQSLGPPPSEYHPRTPLSRWSARPLTCSPGTPSSSPWPAAPPTLSARIRIGPSTRCSRSRPSGGGASTTPPMWTGWCAGEERGKGWVMWAGRGDTYGKVWGGERPKDGAGDSRTRRVWIGKVRSFAKRLREGRAFV